MPPPSAASPPCDRAVLPLEAAVLEPGAEPARQRFQAALARGNPRDVRRAAADMSSVSVADAAAILLVIERTEPENYERTALRWLARVAGEARQCDLRTIALAAEALAALPSEPAARAELALICHRLSLREAAERFAQDHDRFARERDRAEGHGNGASPPAGHRDGHADQPWELMAAS